MFNCVLLQNPMCETMMRFDFSEEESLKYIARIAEIIRPLNPMVIYLKTADIVASVRKAAAKRPGRMVSLTVMCTGLTEEKSVHLGLTDLFPA